MIRPMLIALRSTLLALFAFLLSTAALAGETTYGAGLTELEPIKLSELMDNPDPHVNKMVRVEGLVIDVCAKRGCWVELAGDREFESVRFKVNDGEIVFPVDAKGKRATLEGVFTATELTEEQAIARAKHHAEEQGKPFDPSTVAGKQMVYQIAGKGGVIH